MGRLGIRKWIEDRLEPEQLKNKINIVKLRCHHFSRIWYKEFLRLGMARP